MPSRRSTRTIIILRTRQIRLIIESTIRPTAAPSSTWASTWSSSATRWPSSRTSATSRHSKTARTRELVLRRIRMASRSKRSVHWNTRTSPLISAARWIPAPTPSSSRMFGSVPSLTSRYQRFASPKPFTPMRALEFSSSTLMARLRRSRIVSPRHRMRTRLKCAIRYWRILRRAKKFPSRASTLPSTTQFIFSK